MNFGKNTVCFLAMGLMGSISPAIGQTNSVYSINVVGFQKVTVPPSDMGAGLQLLGVPFDANPGTMDEVVGTHGVYGTSEVLADNIILFDPAVAEEQQYRIFYLRFNNTLQKPMWIAADGNIWATNVYLHANDGFWYRNRSSATITNVLTGDVVNEDTVTKIIQPGLQLLSYPYSTPIPLTDMGLTNGVYGTSEVLADNMIFYDPSATEGQQYVIYYLRFNKSLQMPMWIAADGNLWATNVVVHPHQGFWYRSRSTNNIPWIEEKPYQLD